MKKIILILAMNVLLLTGCNTTQQTQITSTFPKEIVENNLLADLTDKRSVPDFELNEYSYTVGPLEYDVISTNYQSIGLLVLEHQDLHSYGFYSLTEGDFLIEPSGQFPSSSYDYEVIAMTDYIYPIQYILRVYSVYDPDMKEVIIDSHSNVLYEGTTNTNVSLSYDNDVSNIMTMEIEGQAQVIRTLSLNIDNPHTGNKTFYYGYSLITKQLFDMDEISSNTIGASLTDLTSYGLDGYYMSYSAKSNYLSFAIFDNNIDLVNNFNVSLRNSTDKIFFAGGKAIIQTLLALPSDTSEYDFFDGTNKYLLYTDIVDLLSGTTSSVDFPFVINSTSYLRLKDSSGVYNYMRVSGHYIDRKMSGFYAQIIIDGDANILYNVTGLNIGSFIKLSNGYYYDYSGKRLYDDNFKIIKMFIGSVDFLPNLEAFFITENNDKYIYNQYGNLLFDSSGRDVTFYFNDLDLSRYVYLSIDDYLYAYSENRKIEIAYIDRDAGDSFGKLSQSSLYVLYDASRSTYSYYSPFSSISNRVYFAHEYEADIVGNSEWGDPLIDSIMTGLDYTIFKTNNENTWTSVVIECNYFGYTTSPFVTYRF